MTKTDKVNLRMEKAVVKDILQPLKLKWGYRNVSEVVRRLSFEYQLKSKKKL